MILCGGKSYGQELETTALPVDEDDHYEEEGGRNADDGDESEEDSDEAFSDIEDEDLLCSNYVSAPRERGLPHAVVIGVRKGGTRHSTRAWQCNPHTSSVDTICGHLFCHI